MLKKIKKVLIFLLCFCFLFEQSGFAQITGTLNISGYLNQLRETLTSDKFRPAHLRYLSYDPAANNFKILLDKGSLKNSQAPEVEVTTKELLNYFFVGISLPNDKFWVNLRPDSPANIIDPYLAQTDVGKILLDADLQLKKDTAKYTSPQNPQGRLYWDKLYKKAGELFGYDNVTIPTLTRPWIVPDEIIIRETRDNAYIYKATLKVMLEQDYLKDSAVYNFKDIRSKILNEYSSQLIRELIIPELTKEINSAKRYAALRQVYYSLILAQWFKEKFYGQNNLYSSLINRGDLTGFTSITSWSKNSYFQAYQESFKNGEYNIQEPIQTPFGQSIRSYFSGGIAFGGVDASSGILGAMSKGRIAGNEKISPQVNPDKIAGFLVQGGTLNNPAGVKIRVETSLPSNLPTKNLSADVPYAATTIEAPGLGAKVSDIKRLDRLLRLLNVLRGSEKIAENASDREILEACIKYLQEKGLIVATTDTDGNVILTIKENNASGFADETVRRFVDAMHYWVINPQGGVKAVNFQAANGTWTIVGFETELQDKDTLEHERQEIKYRKQGLSWLEAHNRAVQDTGIGAEIDREIAKVYKAGNQDEIGAMQAATLEEPSAPTAKSIFGYSKPKPPDPAGRLEISESDISPDDIAKKEVEADDIISLAHIKNKTTEQKIKAEIARVASNYNSYDQNAIDAEWGRIFDQFFAIPSTDKLSPAKMEKLADKVDNIFSDIKRALEKAVKYKIDLFSAERDFLALCQNNGRLLVSSHPIVVRLQSYLDKMAEPGLPRTRLYVMVDGKRPAAYSIGNAAIINLALIARLDTIDEVVSVLAHEQGHHESGLSAHDLTKKNHSIIEDILAGRLEEYKADLVTPQKLAKLGFYHQALTDALRKIVEKDSSQDITHGNISTRNLLQLLMQRKVDFEYLPVSRLNENMAIPASWKLGGIASNLQERLLESSYDKDFQSAAEKASLFLLKAITDALLKNNPGIGWDEWDEKLLFIIAQYEQRAQKIAQTESFSVAEKDALILSWLLNSGNTNDWEALLYSNSMVLPMRAYDIRYELGKKIISAAAVLDSKFTDHLWSRIAGYGGSGFNQLGEFLIHALIYDSKVRDGVLKEPHYIDSPAYFIAIANYIRRLDPTYSNKDNFTRYMSKALYCYVESFLHSTSSEQRNFTSLSSLCENLQEMNAYYHRLTRDNPEDLYDKGIPMPGDDLFSSSSTTIYRTLSINFTGFDKDQLRELIFGIKNTALAECLRALETKDEQAFLSFLRTKAQFFVRALDSDSPEGQKIEKLFFDDPSLSYWVASVLQKNWQTDLILPVELLRSMDSYQLQKLGIELGEINFKQKEKLERLDWIFWIISNLPVPSIKERFDIINRFIEDPQIAGFLKSLHWTRSCFFLTERSGIFNSNLKEPSSWETRSIYGDKLLATYPFRILIDNLLPQLRDASTLRRARAIYEFIVGSSNNYIYGYSELSSTGKTDFHSQWLTPVNTAYFQYLKIYLRKALSLNNPYESRDYYFALDAVLPDGPQKAAVLAAYARQMIDQMSREDLQDFLLALIESTRLDKVTYAYFKQKRLKTKEDFQYFKQVATGQLQLSQSSIAKLSGLVILDTIIDDILRNDQALDMFRAMIESGRSDSDLRKQLIGYWFVALKDSERLLGYKIETAEGGRWEVTGPAKANFLPFDEFMDRLLNLPEWVKFLMLEKLLLSPNGVLQTDKGRKAFKEIIGSRLPQKGAASQLLKDILGAAVYPLDQKTGKLDPSALDAERLFLALAQPLATVFLQKPEPGQSVELEVLGKKMYEFNEQYSIRSPYKTYIHKYKLGLFRSGKTEDVSDQPFTDFLRSYQGKQSSPAGFTKLKELADAFCLGMAKALGVSSDEGTGEAKAKFVLGGELEPINLILEACQNLGPAGVRFLQVFGQYLPLPDEYQEKLRDAFDATEGQDKFTAFDTLLKVAEYDPLVKKFVEEDLISIDEVLGGGSIVTVFAITVRNRDRAGRIISGTHKETLKIRVPNAETMVREVVAKGLKIIEILQAAASAQDKQKYEIAKRMLNDIRDWVIQDIRDATFLELDPIYQKAHVDYFASNGMAVRVPSSFAPNTKDIKREEFVPGLTLNKILKLILSGESLADLIRKEKNPEVKTFLQNVEKSKLTLKQVLERATRAIIEDFARHLYQPIFIAEGGQGVYILHSDMHFGNVMLVPGLDMVAPIDRNFYLKLTKEDVDFIRQIITLGNDQGLQSLDLMVNYFLSLPENQNNPLNDNGFFKGKARRMLLTRQIGLKIKASGNTDPLSVLMQVLQELEARDVVIPLKIRIMFKNLLSINAMLQKTGAGEFKDYVLAAEKSSSAPALDNIEKTSLETKSPSQAGQEEITFDETDNRASTLEPIRQEQQGLKDKAEQVLGRPVTEVELAAIQKAHEIGQGHYLGAQNTDGTYTKNSNPRLAYTPQEIAQKARILKEAGFTKEETRKLIFYGVAGTEKIPEIDGQAAVNKPKIVKYSSTGYSWSREFGRDAGLIVEIGPQDGKLLAAEAVRNSGNNYVGVEIDEKNETAGLSFAPNLRYVFGDARNVMRDMFRDGEISQILLLFPMDPILPERARLLNNVTAFVQTLLSKLKPGGEFKIVTESKEYAEAVEAALKKYGFTVTSETLTKNADETTLILKTGINLRSSGKYELYQDDKNPERNERYFIRAKKVETPAAREAIIPDDGATPPESSFGEGINEIDKQFLDAQKAIGQRNFGLAKAKVKEAIRFLREVDYEKLDDSGQPVADMVNQAKVAIYVIGQLIANNAADTEILKLESLLRKGINGEELKQALGYRNKGIATLVPQRQGEKKPSLISLKDIEEWHKICLLDVPDSTSINNELQGYYGGDYLNHPQGLSLDRAIYLKNPDLLGYRTEETMVLWSTNGKFISVSEIPEAMSKYITWFNSQLSILLHKNQPRENEILQFAAEAHIKFARIHPFKDGNGRTAEYITNYILKSFGYPEVNNLRIEYENFETRQIKSQYSDAVQKQDTKALVKLIKVAQLLAATQSSTAAQSTGAVGENKVGGIDLRSLPIVTQPMNRPAVLSSTAVPLGNLENIKLDKELLEIQKMLNAGIIPSGERMKKYVESCCAKQDFQQGINQVLSCIADVLRIEEERTLTTEPELKAFLIILESGKPAAELKLAISRIQFESREPQVIGP